MAFGRPKKEIDHVTLTGWELIDAIIAFASQEYIASLLNMSIQTLNEKIKETKGVTFLEYKKQKKEYVKISVLQKQFEIAMGGNPVMNIWLGKQYAGQKDKSESEVSTPQGKVFKLSYKIDE